MTSTRMWAFTGSMLLASFVIPGCSSSHPSNHPAPTSPTVVLMPQSWRLIHPTDNARVLLIDVTQSTRNPHDPCWTRSITRVDYRHNAFYITLRQGSPSLPPGQACPAIAVKGPFYATVQLQAPYRDQPLIDAVSGQRHAPRALVNLADVPKQFR